MMNARTLINSSGPTMQPDRWDIRETRMSLSRFNQLDRDAVAELLRTCLNVDPWVHAIVDARPFPTSGAIQVDPPSLWSGNVVSTAVGWMVNGVSRAVCVDPA